MGSRIDELNALLSKDYWLSADDELLSSLDYDPAYVAEQINKVIAEIDPDGPFEEISVRLSGGDDLLLGVLAPRSAESKSGPIGVALISTQWEGEDSVPLDEIGHDEEEGDDDDEASGGAAVTSLPPPRPITPKWKNGDLIVEPRSRISDLAERRQA